MNDTNQGFKLEKILTAIDGSGIADYALNLVIHIGEKYGSKIDLLYVATPSVQLVNPQALDPMFGGTAVAPAPAGISEKASQNEAMKAKSLLEDRKKLVEAQHLACETITVASEDIGGEIVKYGSSKQYDLIALGSTGMSGFRSFLLGSVSRKVAREAKSSVLIVKSRIDSLPRILLAYDGSDPSKKALNFAEELGKKFKAHVSVICVASIPISPEGYVMPDVDKWVNEMRKYVDEAVSQLRKHEIDTSGQLIEARDVSRAITLEAEKGNYDIIIVGSRGFGRLKSLFLGSVASGVADSSKTNVLVVR
jgi:nucleotide-binding universal stress UspA family protein